MMDKTKKDNFRKLSFCKLFEAITLSRADPWLIKDTKLESYPSKMFLFAHREMVLTIIKTSLLSQTQCHAKHLILCGLKGSFISCFIYENQCQAVRIVVELYSKLLCKGHIGATYSHTFQVICIVFKREKWPMRLSEIFYCTLLIALVECYKGCSLYLTSYVCSTYTDDLVICDPNG